MPSLPIGKKAITVSIDKMTVKSFKKTFLFDFKYRKKVINKNTNKKFIGFIMGDNIFENKKYKLFNCN